MSSEGIAVPSFPAIPLDAGKDFRGKVVIIGAGVTGLFAANTLKLLGVTDFVVLEAGETFGGRLKSAVGFHDEVPLELGAEWIHAPTGDVCKDMLVFPAEEGLEPSEFVKYQPQWFFRGSKSRFMGWVYQETKWKRMTWGQWLEKYVYRHVQENVQFNVAVKEVAYGEAGGQVKLLLANGAELRADKVICTVPLSVLKQEGAVKFEPPLSPQKRQAIEKIGMLSGLRVLFEMKEKFYPDLTSISAMWELAMDSDQVCFAYDALYGKELSGEQNVLAFVAIGDKFCKDLVQLDDEELAKAALAKIDQLFKGQGTTNYVKHEVQNWNREPHILGAYSVGSHARERGELRKTVDDKILFAGEHTCNKYFSLVPGAALEGRRAGVEAVSGLII